MKRLLCASCLGLLVALGTPTAASAGDGHLLHTWPSEKFVRDARTAERDLNRQAAAGYRLLALGRLALWTGIANEARPEYRVVAEPSVHVQTPGHMRDAGLKLVADLNAAARVGYRVHRRADWWNFAIDPRTALGAVVLERALPPGSPCFYDVLRMDRVSGEDTPVRAGFEPLPIRLREWVVLERCAPEGSVAPEIGASTTLRFVDGGTFATGKGQIEAVSRKIDAARAQGCTPAWATFKGVVLWCRPDVAAPAGYTVLGLTKVGGVQNATMYRTLQESLSEASAAGLCVVGGEFIEGTVNKRVGALVLGESLVPGEGCEYHVVAWSAFTERVVATAFGAGFTPAPRVRFGDGLILERRRPLSASTASTTSDPMATFPLGLGVDVQTADARSVRGVLVSIDDEAISVQSEQGALALVERSSVVSVSPYVAKGEKVAHVFGSVGGVILIPIICGLASLLFAYHG